MKPYAKMIGNTAKGPRLYTLTKLTLQQIPPRQKFFGHRCRISAYRLAFIDRAEILTAGGND